MGDAPKPDLSPTVERGAGDEETPRLPRPHGERRRRARREQPVFAASLRRAGVPFELHLYERGPHASGW